MTVQGLVDRHEPERGVAPTGFGPDVELWLVGRLRILDRTGNEIALPNLKAQGVLALLGAAPNLRRTRAWIQDKLWSDREAEQGAASLRQTLLRLRRALGPLQFCIVADGPWIGLDMHRVRIVGDPAAWDWSRGGETPEFVEGLDIADPEFEEWVRDQRLAFGDRAEAARDRAARRLVSAGDKPPAQVLPMLLLAPPDTNSPAMRTLADMLAANIGAQVANVGAAEILTQVPSDFAPPRVRALTLRIGAFSDAGLLLLHAQLVDPSRNTQVWSASRKLRLDAMQEPAPDPLHLFTAEAANVIAFELGRRRAAASELDDLSTLGYRALQHATDFTLASLVEGDRLLEQAFEARREPVYLAWRAHIRLASIIERFASRPSESLYESADMVERAMARDPFNPLIRAIGSDVLALLDGGGERALDLARSAIDADPANAFARASLAYRLAWTDRRESAHAEAVRALKLAERQPNRLLWVMRCCLTAARAGRYDEAIRYGMAAHRLAPDFKPPLRYLIALFSQTGDTRSAVAALDKLKALEPDFTLQMFEDESYPVASIRGTPLIGVTRSGLG